jgi:thiol-disulfide isomerase/thioredoxin
MILRIYDLRGRTTLTKKNRKRPLRKRQEIKREQIRKREIIRKIKYMSVLVILIIIVSAVLILYQPPNENDTNDNNTPGDNNGNNVGTEVGQIAPVFELADTDNVIFNLEDSKGSVIVLDFMATWCGPCETELEHLKDVRSSYDYSTVKIVSIDIDDTESADKLNNFKYNHSCDWIFAAGGGSVGDTYKIGNIPTIYIIDKQGTVAYKKVGVADYSILKSEIDKLI